MLRALPWPGHSRSRRQLSSRSSPRGAWHKGGRGPVSLHPLILREVDSEQEYMCNRGGGDVTASSKEGQSWPQRHGNIAWGLELCSSGHPVAFCLPPAAHRPCDFLVPMVPVTQNAFLSTSGAQVTTNRPPPSILYVFHSAVSDLQFLINTAHSWGLVVCLLCVFLRPPSPTKLAIDSLSCLFW